MGMIGLYDERNNEEFCLFSDPNIKFGSYNGITQVQFSNSGKHLLSTSRNYDELLCWDIRNTGDIMHRFKRPGSTNQRLYFDVFDDKVFTGDTDGMVSIYDISTGTLLKQFRSNNCPVSGCSISKGSLLATCSGQREFPLFEEDLQSDNCDISIWNLQ